MSPKIDRRLKKSTPDRPTLPFELDGSILFACGYDRVATCLFILGRDAEKLRLVML